MIKSERKFHIEPLPNAAQFSLKVAFATRDRHHVDQHFGMAKCVLIYGISEERWSLVEAIEYPTIDENTHDKLPARISDLEECSAIYCNACGAAAIRQLLSHDINPVKVSVGAKIHAQIEDIQAELKGQPMGWLARALKLSERKKLAVDHVEERLDRLMDEEW